jgi:hypothetical protein
MMMMGVVGGAQRARRAKISGIFKTIDGTYRMFSSLDSREFLLAILSPPFRQQYVEFFTNFSSTH